MKKTDFRKLFDDKILILDGATGTNLMNAGILACAPRNGYLNIHR